MIQEKNTITFAIQVNGKLLDTMKVSTQQQDAVDILAEAKHNEKVIVAIAGKRILQEKVMSNGLVNIITD
jgi:hypothetical protein